MQHWAPCVSRVLKKLGGQTSRQQETETFTNLAEGIFSPLPLWCLPASLRPLSTDFSLTYLAPLLLHVFPVPIWTHWASSITSQCCLYLVNSSSLQCLCFCIQTVPVCFLRCCVLCLGTATKLGKEMQPTFVLKNKQELYKSELFQSDFACFPQALCLFWKCCVSAVSVYKIALSFFGSMALKWHQLASQIFKAQTNLHFCKNKQKKKTQKRHFSRTSSLQNFHQI